jgi:polygalacturonase
MDWKTNSVKSFGAVGDGVTNDTEAIQRAFDATHVHREHGGQSRKLTTVPGFTYTGLEIVGSGDEEPNA